MRILLLLLGLVLVSACKYREAPLPKLSDEAVGLRDRPGVAGRPFVPPADGRLTPEQIMGYVDVQEKVNAHAEEMSAASEVGFSADEYAWVKEQVFAASGSETAAREIRARLERSERWTAAGLDFTKAEIQQAHDAATDEQTRRVYAAMLLNYDRWHAEMLEQLSRETTPAVVYNRQLLAPHACRDDASSPTHVSLCRSSLSEP
ncbi:MAG TPA: hypothetical protein VGQ36_05205 [Thermoanaerobaculia bacterium]|jgi:hypothetical protein|nr:hypothetical protein [Thermoanaerobaculia bacterium]